MVQSMPDDAGQFGSDADLSKIDISASYAAYDVALLAMLVAAYPGAEVTIKEGADCIEVNGMRDHSEGPAIEDILHETWGGFGWVVTK